MFSELGSAVGSVVKSYSGRPKILLVDDDVTFGRIMTKMAEKVGLSLHYMSSANEIHSLKEPDFDIGIFDFDLGAITGLQLTAIVEKYLGNVPILLVSSYGKIENRKKWPELVVGFIPKSKGFYSILAEACRIFEESGRAATVGVIGSAETVSRNTVRN